MNMPYQPQQPGQWNPQQYPPAPPGYGPQQPGPPGYGQPQPGPAGYGQDPSAGGGAIAVDSKYFPLAFLFAMMKPQVIIDGRVMQGSWGRSVIPVQPGNHQVHVHVPYLMPSKVGPADLTVPVHPGQTVELEYRAPVWAFARGALGAAPQKYNGMSVLIVIMAVAVLLSLCTCVVPFLLQ